jgi:DNA polymerase-1
MANAANETKLINFFKGDDPDIHSFTARDMWKVEVHQELKDESGTILREAKNLNLRSRAKILNFGIPFGMGEHKLADDFEVDVVEAKQFIDNWLDTYPNLKKFFSKQIEFVLKHGYVVVDPFTLRRSYSPDYKDYLKAQEVIQMLQNTGKTVPKQL